MAVVMGDSVQRYPLLRLLFFYVCGLGLADVCYPHWSAWTWWYIGISVVALFLIAMLWRKVLGGVAISALFLFLGVWCYGMARSENEYDWSQYRELYEARVVSVPRARQRSVACELQVMAVRDSSAWNAVGKKVLAYMEPSSEVNELLPGDVLCFRGKVRVPSEMRDSLTFDYARYVAMQGASGTIYLPREAWHKVGEARSSVREHMLCLRQHLLDRYMATTFEGDVLGVLSALTLGDRRALSAEQRAVYSDAGASHVLALSGMHVGVIYGVLVLLLNLLLRGYHLRWLREMLAVAVLWLFALLVGMPASVVRAVIMCTLYVVARWVSDDTSSPLHVLSLTALVMLLMRPLYLFDVGFQLSFMAMCAILWLVPRLEKFTMRYEKHPVLVYFVGLLYLSLSAQLGTFPLVLHYFGTFPTYFLVTNLLVVPCLSFVLILSLLWWTLLLVGVPWMQQLGLLLQHLVEWTNGALGYIGQWPYAVLHVEYYGVMAVFFTYLFILFAGLYVTRKWNRGAVLAMASLLGVVLSLLFNL